MDSVGFERYKKQVYYYSYYYYGGTDCTGMTIHPFTILLNERSIEHSETYCIPKYPRWENIPHLVY